MNKIFALLLLSLTPTAFATRIDLEAYPEDDQLISGISRCTPFETARLSEAVNAAQMRATGLQANWNLMDLFHTRDKFVIPENRLWIDGSPKHGRYQNFWSEVGATFSAMARADVNIQCEIASDKVCRSSSVLAYVRFFLGKPLKLIHACPLLFESDQRHVNEVIFHELSHYTSSTEDLALNWWSRDNLEIEKAAKDAYFIQRFMNEEADKILRNQIWVWWWPKAGSNTLPAENRVTAEK